MKLKLSLTQHYLFEKININEKKLKIFLKLSIYWFAYNVRFV